MITVIGSINLDLIATVERLPAPGETVLGDGFNTAPGGKGANQALAAVRAGAKVRMIGAVGGDAFAAEATALLGEGGVDLSAVSQSERPTGVALILVGDHGENVIAVVPGANGTVGPDAVTAAGITSGEHVVCSTKCRSTQSRPRWMRPATLARFHCSTRHRFARMPHRYLPGRTTSSPTKQSSTSMPQRCHLAAPTGWRACAPLPNRPDGR